MPTLIDEFVIELGLDPKEFIRGKKEVEQEWARLQENAKKRSEETTDKLGTSLTTLTRKALGFAAIISGGMSLEQFTQHVVHSDFELGRFAQTLGMTPAAVKRWQVAMHLAGGDAGEVDAAFTAATKDIQTFNLYGESNLLPLLNAMQQGLMRNAFAAKNAEEYFLDLADIIHDLGQTDSARAFEVASRAHFSMTMYNIALKEGRKGMQDLLSEAQRLNPVTDKNIENATQLWMAWSKVEVAAAGFGESLLRKVTPAAVGFLDNYITPLLQKLQWYATPFQTLGERSADFRRIQRFRRGDPNEHARGSMSSDADIEAYIRTSAKARGIDPEIAIAVARNEGLPSARSYVGDNGTSYGPYQLHYSQKGNAVGDQFTRQTGLDARDPRTMHEQIDFALDWAKMNGWTDWHGWKGAQWAGIQQGGRGSTSNDVRINTLNVNLPNVRDPQGFDAGLKSIIERQATASHAATGGE